MGEVDPAVLVVAAVDGLLCTGQRGNGGLASLLPTEALDQPLAQEGLELSTYR